MPVEPEGSVKTGWLVPAGESLLLTDFNLAECLRCPLGGDHKETSIDTVNASLVLRAGHTQDTLVVKALFGRVR